MDFHYMTRISENLLARVSGPMKFRLLLQPSTSLFLAIRGGLRDARVGDPPYFWGLFTGPAERRVMLKDGWKSISKLFIFAVLLDVIYQIIEQRFVYVGEAVLVAVILAMVPYLLVRGPVNRIARDIQKERLAGR